MAAYRDDREALLARIEQLEGELDRAQAELVRLRDGEEAESRQGSLLLGGKTRIVHERTLEGELPDETLEELVETLRFHFGQMGRSESIGKTFAWQTEATRTAAGGAARSSSRVAQAKRACGWRSSWADSRAVSSESSPVARVSWP